MNSAFDPQWPRSYSSSSSGKGSVGNDVTGWTPFFLWEFPFLWEKSLISWRESFLLLPPPLLLLLEPTCVVCNSFLNTDYFWVSPFPSMLKILWYSKYQWQHLPSQTGKPLKGALVLSMFFSVNLRSMNH